MKANLHEARNRTAKALRLAHILIAHGATAAMAAALPPKGRSIAADLAGVRRPSDATWAIVEQLLRDRESPRPLVRVNTEALVA